MLSRPNKNMNFNEFNNHMLKIMESLELSETKAVNSFITLDEVRWVTPLKKILSDLAETTPDVVLNADSIEPIKNLIKERKMDYTDYPDNKLNTLFLALAHVIEDIIGISRYQILMSTITNNYSVITNTNLLDKDVQLRHFALSDDGTTPIDIISSLEYAMKDGILRHTSLINGEINFLSEQETIRVTEHSTYTKTYYDTALALVNAKNNSVTFGSILKTLRSGLMRGGEGEMGKVQRIREQAAARMQAAATNNLSIHKDSPIKIEDHYIQTDLDGNQDAKSPANLAIISFIEWFLSLNNEDKKTLLSFQYGDYKISSMLQSLMRIKSTYFNKTSFAPTFDNISRFPNSTFYTLHGNNLYYVDKQKWNINEILVEVIDGRVAKINEIENFLYELYKTHQMPILVQFQNKVYLYGFNKDKFGLEKSYDSLLAKFDFLANDGKILKRQASNQDIFEKISRHIYTLEIVEVSLTRPLTKELDHIFSTAADEPRLLSLIENLEITQATNHCPQITRDPQCVQLASDAIDLILENNEDIFKTIPSYDGDTEAFRNSIQMLYDAVNLSKKSLVEAMRTVDYKILDNDRKKTRQHQMIVQNINSAEYFKKLFSFTSYEKLLDIIPFIQPNLLVTLSNDLIKRFTPAETKTIIDEVRKEIYGKVSSSDYFTFELAFAENPSAFIDANKEKFTEITDKVETLSLLLEQIHPSPDLKTEKIILDEIQNKLPIIFTTMEKCSFFHLMKETELKKILKPYFIPILPKLAIDLTTLTQGLLTLITDDEKSIFMINSNIPDNISSNSAMLKILLKSQKQETNGIILRYLLSKNKRFIADFNSLILALKYTEDSAHQLLLTHHKDIFRLINNATNFSKILYLLSPHRQAELLDIFPHALLSLNASLDDCILTISTIHTNNLKKLDNQIGDYLIALIGSISKLDQIFTAYRGELTDTLYAKYKEKMVTLLFTGQDLMTAYKWVPNGKKAEFLLLIKPKLANLIEDGDQFAVLNKDLDATAVTIFDNIDLPAAIQTPAQFILSAANQHFQTTLVHKMLEKLPKFTREFDEKISLLKALLPDNRKIVAEYLISNQLLHTNIDDHDKFMKLINIFSGTATLAKIVLYFYKQDLLLRKLITQPQQVAALLKICVSAAHFVILRTVDLITITQNMNDLHIIESALETEKDYTQLYRTLAPEMAKIKGFKEAEKKDALDFEEKKMLTYFSEADDPLNLPIAAFINETISPLEAALTSESPSAVKRINHGVKLFDAQNKESRAVTSSPSTAHTNSNAEPCGLNTLKSPSFIKRA